MPPISLLLGSALVVGMDMYEEKQQRTEEAKKNIAEQPELAQQQGLEPQKQEELDRSKTQNPPEKGQDPQNPLAQGQNAIAPNDQNKAPNQATPEEKGQGGVGEFFKRTFRTFGASVGMFACGLAAMGAAIAVGALLLPPLGVVGAGIVATVAGAAVGFGAKLGVAAI